MSGWPNEFLVAPTNSLRTDGATPMANLEIRRQRVVRLPGGGKIAATIRCSACGHSKSFAEPPSDDHVRELERRMICSRCGARRATLDLFDVAVPASRLVRVGPRKCRVCGVEISELTLEAVPHTECCSEHLAHNPQVAVRTEEPVGSREDFKRDSGANFSAASRPKS